MGGSRAADSLSGLRLGSCVLESPLGVGGMGAVYLARQERPHRQVAVKVLRPHLLTADTQSLQVFLERFRREADATAALDHANIVPIYEFGEERGVAYLVMPYLADGSLAELLAREGELSLATTVQYVEQAAAALDHAHAHGIVHRDVKPSNLLLHPDGRLLLTDFGIARAISRNAPRRPDDLWLDDDDATQGDVTLTQLGSAMGTPEYMAPEQVQGDPVTAASDIYALGILTYVMLSGRSPFGGGDVTTILARQLREPPRPLRALRPDVHAQVEEVIFWTLAKDPAERPASAGAYARSLREARRGHTLGRLWGWTASGETSRGSGLIAATNEQTPSTVSVRLPERTRPLPSSAGQRVLGRADAPSHRTLGDYAPLSSHSQTVIRRPHSGDRDTPGQLTEPRTLADRAAPQRGGTSGGLGGAPIWPGAGQQGAGDKPHHGAWFVLIALASVLVIALGAATFLGALASRGAPNPTATVAHGVVHAPLPTATSTPLATATPTAPANWLTVSPETISLGCKGTKKSATVTIRNAGPRAVSWEAQIPQNFFGSDDVSVSPTSGEVHAGGSATITVTNRTPSTEHSNYIALQLGNEDAGQPPVIAYSVAACFGG